MIYDINGNAVYAEKPINSDYSVCTDFMKKPINLVRLGTLTYQQSFCMYNGHYYSTDGSHIAEQDEDFNVVRNVSINVGHGNSLQLGSNGLAYASGWDDNKIYVVDLTTLTVTDTITLPTTGYTTCAVDDVKHIAYIWQRDTRPNTESYYNFIVYDYENNQTLSTKETTVSFGAMQSVDTYFDLFIVLNGLGTGALPNGYRVYNKSGDVVSEYVIGSFNSIEPEGIFIDRDTNDIYISFINKSVYKIE